MAFFKGDVYSYSLEKMTSISVYLPYDDNRRFSVKKPQRTLVLLHGLEGNHSYWQRYSSVERYAQKNNLALIMPDAEMSLYANMRCGQDYEKYIAIELKQIVSSMFNIATDREKYFIAGLSMGGYGALKLAFAYPEIFGRCASFSGALMLGSKEHLEYLSNWIDKGEVSEYDEDYALERAMLKSSIGAYGEALECSPKNDLNQLAKSLISSGKKQPEILMTCGTEDFLYTVNQDYCKKFKEIGINFSYYEWSGAHEWAFWDESMRDYINFFD